MNRVGHVRSVDDPRGDAKISDGGNFSECDGGGEYVAVMVAESAVVDKAGAKEAEAAKLVEAAEPAESN